MPLSFASILGGLVTLIGTPPNIIIATFRGEALGAPFEMFDFTPVGAACALAGVLFVALVGWRLIPRARGDRRQPQGAVRAGGLRRRAQGPEGAKAIGQKVVRADRPRRKQRGPGARPDPPRQPPAGGRPPGREVCRRRRAGHPGRPGGDREVRRHPRPRLRRHRPGHQDRHPQRRRLWSWPRWWCRRAPGSKGAPP